MLKAVCLLGSLAGLLASGCAGKSEGEPTGNTGTGGEGTAGEDTGSAGTRNPGNNNAGTNSAGTSSAGSAGTCTGKPLTESVPRKTSPTCAPSRLDSALTPDMKKACTTDADCAGPNSLHCLAGTCSGDECASDADCPSGKACSCAADYYGGNGLHGNSCVAAQCRTDADCKSGLSCDEDFGGYCGGPTGFFCHQPSDTCHTDKDCCDNQVCREQPALNHWACQSAVVCSG
jgi:hypothetical protein